jgi:hypothetical protein
VTLGPVNLSRVNGQSLAGLEYNALAVDANSQCALLNLVDLSGLPVHMSFCPVHFAKNQNE